MSISTRMWWPGLLLLVFVACRDAEQVQSVPASGLSEWQTVNDCVTSFHEDLPVELAQLVRIKSPDGGDDLLGICEESILLQGLPDNLAWVVERLSDRTAARSGLTE